MLCKNEPGLNDESTIVRVKAMQNSVKPGIVFNLTRFVTKFGFIRVIIDY